MDLLNFLKQHGISQASLAKSLGVTPSTVNLWVNNKNFPSYEMCKKLLEMGMFVDDLFDIDYKTMHDHDEFLTSKEIEAAKIPFKERFEKCMEEWLKKHKGSSI